MQFSLPIFENLCPGWNEITHLGIQRTYQKGCQVYDLESPINGVYLVTEGQVEIALYTLHGPEKVLYYVGPGCIFGEVGCFVSGDTGEARIRARSDCVTYFFPRELIDGQIAHQYPHLLIELIRASAYKVRMFGIMIRDSATGDHFQRVCKTLVYLVRYKGANPEPGQKQLVIRPDLSQNDLARLMGIHRVTLTKSISRLKAMGIVRRFSKRSLEIINFTALCQLTEDQ